MMEFSASDEYVPMESQIVLSRDQQKALDRVRRRLSESGLPLSDDKLVLALLDAASRLPDDKLTELLTDHRPDPTASKGSDS